MVGGFEQPSAGSITIDGDEVIHLPPERRPFGMVFQSHAVTHMNVFRNIAFGLKLRRLPADEVRRRSKRSSNGVGPTGYGTRGTNQLGGQQQRVALPARWCWSRDPLPSTSPSPASTSIARAAAPRRRDIQQR
jgi:putative spermidine/putrescine transport system ATP-binding protein